MFVGVDAGIEVEVGVGVAVAVEVAVGVGVNIGKLLLSCKKFTYVYEESKSLNIVSNLP